MKEGRESEPVYIKKKPRSDAIWQRDSSDHCGIFLLVSNRARPGVVPLY